MSEHESKSSRIAIHLGKSSTSSPHAIKKRARPVHGKRHRAQALHEGSDSEDNSDEDQQTHGRQETITSYDLLGTSSNADKAQKREGTQKRDGDNAREQQSTSPSDKNYGEANRDDSEIATQPDQQDKPVKWGLTINMKGPRSNKHGEREGSKSRTDESWSRDAPSKGSMAAKDLDDEALDALMGSSTPKRIHPDSDDADREPRPEDYQSVPIDDFGATLLRKFGWDGKMRGKLREVTRHANLTGLGAKDAKEAEDLGAWNQKAAKDSRPVRLHDYQREESKKRQRTDDRYADSYKRERERERESERREHERSRDR
ncbi:hypothetical protein N657DRAFT_619331 [Parathielavia appendiculata]|uniref:Spp2/MOS2 G-patch domain-containing protein n=1 Tax=Parathielavia appendiculata TaxID=2587402 RepID=A0AAN6U0G6_9PEZI|nr:hypothetical protein N657DRAFT_619331 [Parathielavia appendiculata]